MEEYDITNKELKTLVDVHITTARSLERVALNLKDISEEQKHIKDMLLQDQKDFMASVQKIIETHSKSTTDLANKIVEQLRINCASCKEDYLKPVKKDTAWLKIILGSATGIAVIAQVIMHMSSQH